MTMSRCPSFGKNRQFIERTLPHISLLLRPSLAEVIDGSEILAVCKKNHQFEAAVSNVDGKVPVIDLIRVLRHGKAAPHHYEGICW